tara:strand:- start:11347 stop:11718 length:372 start_codon:yes stop_codon:yes gene_type:complete
MPDFTKLELAALHSIFIETPEYEEGLVAQLAGASVAERENTGGGFFTKISVATASQPLSCPRTFGPAIYADVEGLAYGVGFVLFMKDGYLDLLEGYAVGHETTAWLDLSAVKFTISRFSNDSD